MTPDARETAILRSMTPTEKLRVMHELWRMAWQLKAAGLRRQHPDWTEAELTARVRELFGGRVS